MAHILKPPTRLPSTLSHPSIFLAGSIDMGRADQWQQTIEATLQAHPITILNPRRDDWDATWEQRVENVYFAEQVTWELDAQDRADCIAMYFAPNTQAPITLLELGLFAQSGKLVVCCPTGYWRKGNVDMVCRRYAIKQVPTLTDLCTYLAAWSKQRTASTTAAAEHRRATDVG